MRNKLRRPLAFLLSAVMIVTMSGTPVHAVADRGQPETGLCEHHAAHTDDCGYTEETPGTPCGHEHTEDCYTEVTECVHEHTPECYPEETEDSVSDNEATPANAEERDPENCPHICDGESGCITEKLDCRHEHKVNGGEADREGGLGRDSECGYTESTPGTPCTFVCEICNPQDSGEAGKEPETGIIKQEHCSCLTLCTEGQINPDCLVCGAENAGLSDGCAPESRAPEIHSQPEAAPPAAFANEAYSPEDVAVVNAIIANNGLSAAQDDPANWGDFATWNSESPKRITHLTVAAKNLTGTLDVSGLSSLVYLYCYDNQLAELDVSGLSSLRALYCYNNQLAALDVSGLSSLRTLYCSNNQLTALNASGLSDLYSLYCHDNQLAALDVSGLSSLDILYCNGNQLAELDVSGLSSLTALFCYNNQLAALDVSGLSRLDYLHCYDNRLAALDVSGLSSLVYLYCYNNQLTVLDVSGLSSLQTLRCNDNQLTELDVSGLPGLTALYCNNNQLTVLNVSGLSNMYALYCYNNQLTALDVSGLSGLQTLRCNNNQLMALTDKSGHTLTVIEPRHGTVQITDYRIPFTPDEQPTFTLTAVPTEKYAFAQWNGLPEGISSDSNPVTFSLDGDLNVEAIFKVKLTDDMVTVPDQVYTGREIKPEPVVSAVIDGKRVVFQNGTDFTCSYADNISAGTASVTVTPTENGLLTQTAVTKTFAIRKSDSEFTGGILLDHADGQYTYGETILFSVTPAVKPSLRSLTAAEHTVDFYCGGTKLNDTPVTAAEGTAAVFAYDTGKKGIPSGAHTITAVYGGSGSLNGTEETAEVTLRKATITITADDQQAGIGAAKPELTYTVSGLVGGDTLAAEPTLTCSADMDTIGQYPITANGAAVPSGGNYNEAITYVPGTLSVIDPTIAVTGVTLNKTSMTLIVGRSEQLTATVTPGNATDQTVTWASSNTAVAKVDSNGTVAAVSAGNATITVTTADGGKTANCIVTVEKKTPPPAQYNVTVQAGTGGTASASPTSATAGTKITLIATPNSGYQFKEWQVISGGVTISGNRFTMPATNVTVKAVFEQESTPPPPVQYSVTVQAGTGGTASASPASATAGTIITLTATPNSGYQFKEWQVISGDVAINNNRFTMPAANVTVKAIFEKDGGTPPQPTQYSVTVQAGTGGTASASPASAEKGTKITLNATPDSGYYFKEWQVISGGVTISGNSFTMPAANVTVKAIFERDSNDGGNPGDSSSGDNGSSGDGSTIVARPDETKPDTPTTSQTKPAAPDKNGNVAVDNDAVQSAINTAKNDAKKNGNTANGVTVVIPVTPKEGQNSFNVTLNP